ncbi:MAG: zf-HC2 domain-containing protein [bacterium]|nr:zf-HC2 domain-containing protein [bacterium]
MKVCVEWWTALSAYVDDSLPPDERERVEAHLEGCASCQQTVVELQALRQSVKLLPHYEPPPMLKARILSATVDQPTWSEKLAMNWRRLVWRASLATATAVLVLTAWQFIPRQIQQSVNTRVSGVAERRVPLQTQQAKRPQLRRATNTMIASGKTSSAAQRPATERRVAAAPSRPSQPQSTLRWSTIARARVAAEPAPADVLQGEPVIEDDVPRIDVNSPPAGANEQVAEEPGAGESQTVATRFALPAEVLNQGTSGLEALREQIRIHNQEQWSGQIKRNLQRKQVEVDVIKVRF